MFIKRYNQKINFFFSYKAYFFPLKERLKLLKILKLTLNKKPGFVNLFFIGKRKSKFLNFNYRKYNYPTDVLSFPFLLNYKEKIKLQGDELYDLGDIFICYPIALIQSKGKKIELNKEIQFLFLHGLLHLLGYDHEKKSEKKKMYSFQNKILKLIK